MKDLVMIILSPELLSPEMPAQPRNGAGALLDTLIAGGVHTICWLPWWRSVASLGRAQRTEAAPRRKLVFSNSGYMGMVRQWQELNHGNRLSQSWNESLPDFVALAKAFGWGARQVFAPAELEAALAECLVSDRLYFLDVPVAQQESCFR